MADDTSKMGDIDERLSALTQPDPDPDCLYYAITLTADEDLNVIFGLQTEWVGWTDESRRHELRQGRLVYANFVKIWQNMRQPYAIIRTVDDLTLFLLAGGNALVKKELAEQVFSNIIRPEAVANVGPIGFQSLRSFGKTAFARAPTPRLRMDVLKRDGRRCRVCGRRPDDNSDLELHIHHIRPWAKGGITDASNLITLCHTCHNGLIPHEDHSLYGYLKGSNNPLEAMLLGFFKDVANYRKVGFFGGLKDPNSVRERQRNSPKHRKSLATKTR